MPHTSILPQAWDIPDELRSRLGATVGHQRPMFADGHLLLVLHAPPKPEDQQRVGRFFWRTPDGKWTSNEFGNGIGALEKHLDEYEACVVGLDRQEHEARSAAAYFEVLEQLTPLHRAARNLDQVLQEARKMCPDFHDLIDLRDRAYNIERRAELLFNGAKNSLDFVVAKRAEDQAIASDQMAVAAHRLNILAAFFFPIVTLTAIVGVDLATVAAILGIDPNEITGKGIAMTYGGALILSLAIGGILMKFINRPT